MVTSENEHHSAAHVNSSQTVMSSKKHRGHKYLPYAFTEQGVAMLSSVLNSPQAIAVNIEVMRAFVRLREVLTGNKELATKLLAIPQDQREQAIRVANALIENRKKVKANLIQKAAALTDDDLKKFNQEHRMKTLSLKAKQPQK